MQYSVPKYYTHYISTSSINSDMVVILGYISEIITFHACMHTAHSQCARVGVVLVLHVRDELVDFGYDFSAFLMSALYRSLCEFMNASRCRRLSLGDLFSLFMGLV